MGNACEKHDIKLLTYGTLVSLLLHDPLLLTCLNDDQSVVVSLPTNGSEGLSQIHTMGQLHQVSERYSSKGITLPLRLTLLTILANSISK